jgi:hypothetical protein
VKIFGEDVRRVLHEHFPIGVIQVILELVKGDVVAWGHFQPLEERIEIVFHVVSDVELVDRHAIGNVHSDGSALLRLGFVVLSADQIVGFFENLRSIKNVPFGRLL